MPNIFISYRRDDATGYAGRLHDALERHFGENSVFRDVDTLAPGQDFMVAIDQRLRECRAVVVLIGCNWLDARDAAGRRRLDRPDDYVRREIAAALNRPDMLVIPVLIEGAEMPHPEQLTKDIRALSRRHAISLRDDGWDNDVERVVASIRGAMSPSPGWPLRTPKHKSVRKRIHAHASVAVTTLVVAATILWMLTRSSTEHTREQPSGSPNAAESASAELTGDAPPEPPGPVNDAAATTIDSPEAPYAIAIPSVAEVVHESVVYTLLSASVTPVARGTSELRLRIRFTNNGPYDANAWDASFRLAVGGSVIAPISGLNEVVPGHSDTLGVVTFPVPADARRVVLRILHGARTAELPLGLARTGMPIESEAADPLSQALVRTLRAEPLLLLRTSRQTVTVERLTSRRFVNAIRLRLTIGLVNTGDYPIGEPRLRVVADGRSIAARESPGLILDAEADGEGEFEFEVPTETSSFVLRATTDDTTAELSFDLP